MWRFLDRLGRLLAKAPFADRLVPASLRGKVRPYIAAKSMRRLPDRLYMESDILPKLSALQPKRVLFVGAERYTKHYEQPYTRIGAEYWTLDIRPEVSPYGAKDRHKTGSVIEADGFFAEGFFDQIYLNGVFGWGVDDRDDQERTIRALHRISAPGAILMLGWNDNRVPEPLELQAIQDLYKHGVGADLPSRKSFEGSTHVYDFFQSKS